MVPLMLGSGARASRVWVLMPGFGIWGEMLWNKVPSLPTGAGEARLQNYTEFSTSRTFRSLSLCPKRN